MHIRTHLGIGFEVWNGGHAWFWMVTDPHRKRAVIGVVADETDAIAEARASIEEISSRPRGFGWRESLANLDRYLASARAELA